MISVISPSSGTIRSMLATWTLLPSLSVAVAGSFGAVSVAMAAAGEAARVGEAAAGEATAAVTRGVAGEVAAAVLATVAAGGGCVAAVLAVLPALLLLLLQAMKAAASSAAASGRRARAVGITRATPAVRMARPRLETRRRSRRARGGSSPPCRGGATQGRRRGHDPVSEGPGAASNGSIHPFAAISEV